MELEFDPAASPEEPRPQARVIPNGEPIEGGMVLFAGSIEDTRAFLATMSDEERDDVSVWTPGHVFTVAELEATPPGEEHR